MSNIYPTLLSVPSICVEVSTTKNTLPARSDGDLGGQAGDLVQRPVVDDLRVVGPLWLPS